MQATRNVWAFSPNADLVGATEVALDQLRPPDLGISILRDYGDEIRVAVDWGGVADPSAILYVQHRGMYRLAGNGRAAPVRHAPGRQTLKLVAWRVGEGADAARELLGYAVESSHRRHARTDPARG